MRKSYGAFQHVDDLLAIRGISPKCLEKIRKYLMVGKTAAPSAVQPNSETSPPASKPLRKP